jgi:hypothetical protein
MALLSILWLRETLTDGRLVVWDIGRLRPRLTLLLHIMAKIRIVLKYLQYVNEALELPSRGKEHALSCTVKCLGNLPQLFVVKKAVTPIC